MVTKHLSPEDTLRLVGEIKAAEQNTSGEIYVVVAAEVEDFRFVSILWAAFAALLLPWPLLWWTNVNTPDILLIQAFAFAVLSALFSLRAVRPYLTTPAISDIAVRRAALAQFHAHGVHMTKDRTGVLLFVCLKPRRIEVVADAGIHKKVKQQVWEDAVAAIAHGARSGKLADGLANTIRNVGHVLAEHFPQAQGDINELPNRVVQI